MIFLALFVGLCLILFAAPPLIFGWAVEKLYRRFERPPH